MIKGTYRWKNRICRILIWIFVSAIILWKMAASRSLLLLALLFGIASILLFAPLFFLFLFLCISLVVPFSRSWNSLKSTSVWFMLWQTLYKFHIPLYTKLETNNYSNSRLFWFVYLDFCWLLGVALPSCMIIAWFLWAISWSHFALHIGTRKVPYL